MPGIAVGELGRGLLYILASAAVCCLLVLAICRLFPAWTELNRKLLHLSVIVVLSVWLYAFSDWRVTVLTMAVLLAVVFAALVLIEKYELLPALLRFASERKPGELRKSLCAVCLMFMLVAAVGWGWLGERSLALAAVFAWGPGDAAAALIGKRFGRTKIGREKRKSLEGTLAMFTISWACVLAVLLCSRRFPFWTVLPLSVVTGAVSALVELQERRGLDTIFCPAAAMAVLCLGRLLQ